MENAELQTTVHAKLDGRVPTAINVFDCLDVITAHVPMHLIAPAKMDGLELIATLLNVKIALMVTA